MKIYYETVTNNKIQESVSVRFRILQALAQPPRLAGGSLARVEKLECEGLF